MPPLIAKIENMAFRIIIPVPEKQFAKTDMKKAYTFRIYPGRSQLQTFTAYKAEDAGKHCEFVAANGTSQECCICGNILKKAVGTDCAELTPVESIQKELVEAGSLTALS